MRLKKGMSLKEALTKPVRKCKKKIIVFQKVNSKAEKYNYH
jgi:hypothetical protein